MSTNNQTTDKDTNFPYKLPTDIEKSLAVFDEKYYGELVKLSDNELWIFCRSGEPMNIVRNLLATEQITLLEWMLGEIGEDEELVEPMCTLGGMQYNRDVTNRNNVRAELRAKVQAKIKEYKV